MFNKCVAQGCSTGNLTEVSAREENVATFHFPVKKPELLNRWTRFVNKPNWTATSTSVLCEKHFKEDVIKRGKKTTLNWNLNPIPTIQSTIARKRPSSLLAMSEMRGPPKIRNIEEDQISDFNERDVIKNFKSIDPVKHRPKGYEAKVNSSSLLFYRTVFNEETDFPSVGAAILIDQNLHVKLQCNGAPVPLPKWFTSGRDAKLTRFSMLDNFPAYIESFASLHQQSTILEELRQRGKLPFQGSAPILIIFVGLFFTASIYIASMLSLTTATLPSSFFFSVEETQQQRGSRNESCRSTFASRFYFIRCYSHGR